MFGSHLSIAGGMHNALLEAEKLGMNTVQVFTKNQQQWKSKPLDPQAINCSPGSTNRIWRAESCAFSPYSVAVTWPICQGPSISLPRHQYFTPCGCA